MTEDRLNEIEHLYELYCTEPYPETKAMRARQLADAVPILVEEIRYLQRA